MTHAPLPPDETARLLDLARYHVLDTPREEVFDRITRLAARVLDVPIAAINFIDVDRHWSKATVGLDVQEIPRAYTFCAWTILQDEPLVVPDLAQDARFADNPGVSGDPHLRLYAGAPLKTPTGHRIGTLCVMDTHTRTLGGEDLRALQDLAATAMSELELRTHVQHLQRQMEAQAEHQADLRRSLDHARTLEAIGELMDLPLTPGEVAAQAASLTGQAIGADWTGLVTFRGEQLHAMRVQARSGLPPALLHLSETLNTSSQGVTSTLRGLTEPLYIDDYPGHPRALPGAVQAGLQSAAWIPLGTWAETTFLLLTLRVAEGTARLPWRGSDRTLLEAAARSVRAALHRRAALEAETRLARRDALTGILNRRAFDEDLSAHLASGSPFTVVLSDLDGFKALNDTEGHAQGDRVLRLFGQALDAELQVQGRGDAYRLGGDEFVLLLPGIWAGEEVHEITDQAVLAARQATACRLGTSVGVAHTAEPDAANVVALADARMYEAKRRRKALQAGTK